MHRFILTLALGAALALPALAQTDEGNASAKFLEIVKSLKEFAAANPKAKEAPGALYYGAQLARQAGNDSLYKELLETLVKSHPDHALAKTADRVLKGTAAGGRYGARRATPADTLTGKPAPAFSVTGLDGKSYSPESFKGKVLLIDFWAFWCGPCKAEMPNVVSTYEKYKDKGFVILGISLDNEKTKASMDGYIKEAKMAWPISYDGQGWQTPVAVQYGVRSIPRAILVDHKGVVRYTSVRGEKLEEGVKALLAEREKDKAAGNGKTGPGAAPEQSGGK